MIYTDTKIASNTKSNDVMISFTELCVAISIDSLPSKIKIQKGSWCFNNFFYVNPSSPLLQSRFKENAKILPKNSLTQENIATSRQNLLLFLKNTKKQRFFSK